MSKRQKAVWERGGLKRGDGTRVAVRVSPQELEALKHEAARLGMTMSTLVRWAIYRILEEHREA